MLASPTPLPFSRMRSEISRAVTAHPSSAIASITSERGALERYPAPARVRSVCSVQVPVAAVGPTRPRLAAEAPRQAPARAPPAGRRRAQLAPFRCSAADGREALRDLVPVDGVPPGVDVVRAL